MNKLKIKFEDCYGIKSLDHNFDFSNCSPKAYAIYAPNGVMKTSFAKVFVDLSKGENPKEERYNRKAKCTVESDKTPPLPETIFVLKAEVDLREDNPSVTDILVRPESKAAYDALATELESLKNKLINSLNKLSNFPKKFIEHQLMLDFDEESLFDCLNKALENKVEENLSDYEYGVIFDSKAIEVLKSPEFISKAEEFNQRYQELFNKAGTIYKKGIFNPSKADMAFDTLEKQGFFTGGHKVHLRDEASSFDQAELKKKVQEINATIDNDSTLKKLRDSLAKNVQTQALTNLIETLSPSQVDFLLENAKPINQNKFKQDLWSYYINNSSDAQAYYEKYLEYRKDMDQIEADAKQLGPHWKKAVDRFNDRFVDMPFTLSISNQIKAVLGQEPPRLAFTFKDGIDEVTWSREDIKTLSQGERRAFYLLNFIFEVEARELKKQETLFIIDDPADSFDYKNKHAIVQYLKDLTKVDCFHQIILTHNFDFFRTLAISDFVNRSRCLMTRKDENGVYLDLADGVRNYFIYKIKDKVAVNDSILLTSIPFTRNIIEYTSGENDNDYLLLTSLVHWKNDTDQITVGKYLNVYNKIFSKQEDESDPRLLKDILSSKAKEISQQIDHKALNLEDKIVLSMAIRMQAEIYLLNQLRKYKDDNNYWCQDKNQFGNLIKEYTSFSPNSRELTVLEKVSITVSSNIHLNSFMYEPILDLDIRHLIDLYNQVASL